MFIVVPMMSDLLAFPGTAAAPGVLPGGFATGAACHRSWMEV